MESGWATGDVPNRNWSEGLWREGAEALNGRRMAETILVPHQACQGCFIRCARWIKIDDGPFAMEGPGPEYETLAAFGTMLMNDDLEAVCWVNDICNRYGVDTISTGSAIAFAMEAVEKGVLTKEDAGCDLAWGNVDAIIEMTEQICTGRGLGELLGKGVKRVAEELGQGTEEYAVHVKGMEVPYHDPRAYTSLGVNYATGTRGACHMHGNTLGLEEGAPRPDTITPMGLTRFDQQGKGLMAMLCQDKASVVDSLVLCMITADGMIYPDIARVLQATTGEPWTPEQVAQAGERITNLQRVYSLKCGITGADDKLPKRLLQATARGGQEGHVPDIKLQLQEYYQVRGWDEKGRPTEQKLEELGLLDIVGEF
jgi:aldehyde:ferredoxin oxidoreductase